MKIILIASLFPPYHRGGAEVAATTVATALAQEHEVTVLTIQPFTGSGSLVPRMDEHTPIKNIRVVRFFPLNLFSFIHIARHGVLVRFVWHLLDMVNLHTLFVVRSFLDKEKPDLILTHNLKGIGYTVPCAIRRFLKTNAGEKTRWIHTIHDLGPLYPAGILQYGNEQGFHTTSFLVRLYGAINRWLFGSPPVVISRSLFFLEYFKQRGWFSRSRREQCRHDVVARSSALARPPTDIFKFLFVGQLEEYKGVRVLLDAWKRVRERVTGAELHIVGTGSLRECVATASHEDASIVYHGASTTNPTLLVNLMPQMHAAVVPTLVYENTPLVLIEAYGAGLPVVASALGGVTEAVEQGASGYCVEPGNSEALAQALVRITETEWLPMHECALALWREYDARACASELTHVFFDSQKSKNELY